MILHSSRYPANVVLGTQEQLSDIIKIAEPMLSNGIDFSVLVNEVIDINAHYHGTPPSPYDFHGINYLRIDDCFETYALHQDVAPAPSNDYYAEMDYFYELYGDVVERIFLYTHRPMDELVNQYGAGICYNLRYQRYVGNDLILTAI